MAYSDDARVLVKIAHMYYDDNATQAEIAEQLGVSRPLISKYLAKARELGIVQIRIRDELAHPYASIEKRLERKYGIREVIVVPEALETGIKRSLGQATGRYLSRVLKKNQTLAVSGGTTLYEVANQMPYMHIQQFTVVPMIGGIGDELIDIHANQIAVQLAKCLDADYKLLHAPVVVDSVEAKETFLAQSAISEVMETAKRADIALVGIGGKPEKSTMVQNYLALENPQVLDEQGVIGDICYTLIDEKGQPSDVSWNERVIAVSIDELRNIPTVIGVAQGEDKLAAIHAALKGQIIDVLVTDYPTAETLLNPTDLENTSAS
ncbi:sugar-binding transcriptional regulator [Alicyclobacillus fastidiosus]|uniref:Sugar-binding transcriptional regulator n=1 Tax=Alicyclobacillus fastidiosus TaxID=392011 RepID=A0ABV5AB82_9BACL|nr:sugar-binding transcriptional regulator [Alicyclobacillus fastidiosus]WEH10572.1 sugar-binding transcriptional regulator [Alicyclobacillus fastidiosus]